MRPERPQPQSNRGTREREQLATLLAVMLMLTFGGGFAVFLIFITFGLFLWVIVISIGIAAFVGLHYLIWGRPKPPREE